MLADLWILNWKDVIEIIFFSSIIYLFANWLKKDKQKNLVLPFYLYLATVISTYYLQLYTINTFLIISLPIAISIFIIAHQRSLSKNFVTIKKINMERSFENSWIDELIKSSLLAINKKIDVIFVIEREDNLSPFIDANWTINGVFQKNLFEILISTELSTNKFFWLDAQGNLISYNNSWKHSDNNNDEENWKQDAIIITHKTDALVLKTCSITRSLDIIIQNRCLEKLTASQAMILLERHFTSQQKSNKKEEIEGYNHVPQTKKQHMEHKFQ